MPQEVIAPVDQLGIADGQPKLLTFYHRKGHLIGEAEIPWVPDIGDNAITDDEDGVKDLNPPTINNDYRSECSIFEV